MKKIIRVAIMAFLFCLIKPACVEAVINVTQTDIAETGAQINWNAEAGESSYGIYIWMPESKWENNKLITEYTNQFLGYTFQTQYVFQGLKAGEEYQYIIWAFDADNDAIDYYEGTVCTLPGEVEKVDLQLKWASYQSTTTNTAKKYSLTYNLYVDFANQGSADGYEIRLSDESGKKLKTANAKTYDTSVIRYTFKNLKGGVYQVQVRAYQTFNGKKYYGPWTSAHYALKQPLSAAQFSNGKLFVKWDSLKGATEYEVYVCDKKFGDYEKSKTVKKSTKMISLSKYRGKKFIKGKKYYYYVVAKKKSGGKTYESVLSQRFVIQYK